MNPNSQKSDKLLNEMQKLKKEKAENWRVTIMTEKMEKRIGKLMEGMAQKDEENVRLRKEISKLEEKNRAMKRKMERMEAYIPVEKKLLICRPLPAELLTEMFATLPLENACNLLAKMPNFVLARNVRIMLKSIKTALKANKWNAADCGRKLGIFQQGLAVKHFGLNGMNSLLAVLPIPKLNTLKASIKFYFEAEILESNPIWSDISIGFCARDFPLESNIWLGSVKNSIGISHKGRMDIDGAYNYFGNGLGIFRIGDIIGIGIVHSPANSSMKCFAACNGELLGMFELPAKFAHLQLFPAVTLQGTGDSIKANFGINEWRFNLRHKLE